MLAVADTVRNLRPRASSGVFSEDSSFFSFLYNNNGVTDGKTKQWLTRFNSGMEMGSGVGCWKKNIIRNRSGRDIICWNGRTEQSVCVMKGRWLDTGGGMGGERESRPGGGGLGDGGWGGVWRCRDHCPIAFTWVRRHCNFVESLQYFQWQCRSAYMPGWPFYWRVRTQLSFHACAQRDLNCFGQLFH
jgi:hypothetical protein